jgi:hypothetical protein
LAKIAAMSFYIRVSPLITPVHCITQTEEPVFISLGAIEGAYTLM